MANRNAAGFFRHDDGDGVRLLGDAEAGAVTQTQAAIEGLALADRKDAGGGGDAAVPDYDAPIMQSGLRMKNGEHELAELPVSQLRDGLGNIVHRLAFLTR